MTPISQMTVGEVLSSIRDISIVITTITIGWKVRGWVQTPLEFFHKANRFMENMESGMDTLLTNHIKHIESDLKRISGRIDELPQD